MSLEFFTTHFNLTKTSITPHIDDLIHVSLLKPLIKPKRNGKGYAPWCRRCLIKYKPFSRELNYLEDDKFTD